MGAGRRGGGDHRHRPPERGQLSVGHPRLVSTRDTIGQAKGILIERYDLDDQTAFNTLIKLSQSMNTPLRDIARRVIEDATGQ